MEEMVFDSKEDMATYVMDMAEKTGKATLEIKSEDGKTIKKITVTKEVSK